MVAITATNSATVSLQSVSLRTRLDQARREADQAEVNAQDLQAQADAAQSQAQQSRGLVRDLSGRQLPLDPTYKPQTPDNIPEPALGTPKILVNLYKANGPSGTVSSNALHLVFNAAAPVVNPLGQATGRIVNLSA